MKLRQWLRALPTQHCQCRVPADRREDPGVMTVSATSDVTLLNFKQKRADMGFVHPNYGDNADLKPQFGEQLVKVPPK
jgi:outer membrane biogenesis lipoprotein LolB